MREAAPALKPSPGSFPPGKTPTSRDEPTQAQSMTRKDLMLELRHP